MKVIKIKNTKENQDFLTETGKSFETKEKYLLHTPSDIHQAYLNNGQMTVRAYKANVLGV